MINVNHIEGCKKAVTFLGYWLLAVIRLFVSKAYYARQCKALTISKNYISYLGGCSMNAGF